MKVLFAAGECYPFVKTGGLGDVVGSLPKYLAECGAEVSVVLPLYGDIPYIYRSKMNYIKNFTVPMSWRKQYCGVFKYTKDNVNFYFIDNEYYFKRSGVFGHGDDGERFSFFTRAVLMMLKELDYRPDIIHCHDWHTAMIPVMYKAEFQYYEFYRDIKTVLTVHNLKFQGVFRRDMLGNCLNLDDYLYRDGTMSYYDCINFMQGGLKTCDEITTVSKTYSHEIEEPFFGDGLDGVMRECRDKLTGIVNGIDYEIFNPKTDIYIEKNYDEDSMAGKAVDKLALQKELGLDEGKGVPIISMVTRLTSQKGLDIVKECIEDIICRGVQLVVLGTGDSDYENYFRYLDDKYTGSVSANIKFDNGLAQRIYAGSDIFLMPSLFEPCGLGQLIALRYGTIPVVRETGGLKDTVQFYNEATEEGNGFTFYDYNSYELKRAINTSLDYYSDKRQWKKLMKNAMKCDNSWHKAAGEYISLYQKLLTKNGEEGIALEAAPDEVV